MLVTYRRQTVIQAVVTVDGMVVLIVVFHVQGTCGIQLMGILGYELAQGGGHVSNCQCLAEERCPGIKSVIQISCYTGDFGGNTHRGTR